MGMGAHGAIHRGQVPWGLGQALRWLSYLLHFPFSAICHLCKRWALEKTLFHKNCKWAEAGHRHLILMLVPCSPPPTPHPSPVCFKEFNLVANIQKLGNSHQYLDFRLFLEKKYLAGLGLPSCVAMSGRVQWLPDEVKSFGPWGCLNLQHFFPSNIIKKFKNIEKVNCLYSKFLYAYYLSSTNNILPYLLSYTSVCPSIYP